MTKDLKIILLVGFSLFTMFFGAGNIVFPLKLGSIVGENIVASISGFLLTAVGLPFIGVFAIIINKGNYFSLFSKTGRIPGYTIITLLVLILGLFVANPRTGVVIYKTNLFYLPKSDLFRYIFYFIFYSLIFFAMANRAKIINVLGAFVSPLKLLTLILFIILSIITAETFSPSYETSSLLSFLDSARYGYNTADMFAGFFYATFSYGAILQLFKKYKLEKQEKRVQKIAFSACILAGCLMGLIYIGFMLASFAHARDLDHVPEDIIIIALSKAFLGDYASFCIALVVTIACFASTIALTTISVDFLKSTILKKLPHKFILLLVLFINYCMCNLGFKKIMELSQPFLENIYPPLIVICVLSILNKFYKIDYIKSGFYLTLLVTVLFNTITKYYPLLYG